MNAITLLLETLAKHKHQSFTMHLSTVKQASARCNNCNQHFGAKE